MTEKQEIFTLMGGRVKMARGIYNPTSDAVWLAGFAPTNRIKTVLDIGIGTGGVSLCYAVHNPKAKIFGIDSCSEMLDGCKKNIDLNNADIELKCTDIFTWKTDKTFDLVLTNPPYFKGTPAGHNAHHNTDIYKWTRRAVARVRPRGYICVIIDAMRITDVISAITPICGDIYILPLFGAHNTAERVLIRGRVGVHGGTVLHRGLPMNTDAVLRDGLTIESALTTLGLK